MPRLKESASVPSSPAANGEPVCYGFRYVQRTRPDGSTYQETVPLTLEDVLHPQEGDKIPENPLHEQDIEYLAPVFRSRLPRLPGGLLLCDCLVDWGVRGIRSHSPDISLFASVTVPPPPLTGTFRLRTSGGRCLFVLELVSPHKRESDVVRKFQEYHRVRVPLYVIVDHEREDAPRQVRGYRYTRRRYVAEPLDDQGRLLLEPLGLLLRLRDERVICYDADTGEAMGDYQQQLEARQAAEKQTRRAQKAARQAQRAAREAEAACQAAEQRLRELEAELRRLRGEGPPEGQA
jgi:Uma2 family endonuclease